MSKDLVLIYNDKVTFIDKFNKKREFINCLYHGFSINKFEEEGCKVLKVERPVRYETVYEAEEILDEKEREYLSYVIRPFRDRIEHIAKYKGIYDKSEEYIVIFLKDEYITFPFFKEGTMYKGMELKREYTLEELGL